MDAGRIDDNDETTTIVAAPATSVAKLTYSWHKVTEHGLTIQAKTERDACYVSTGSNSAVCQVL